MSSTGKFLRIELIYTGTTPRSLPKYDFPVSFFVGFTKNHWSNTDKSINHSSLSTAVKGGKGITIRATLASYSGHLQRTGQCYSKRVLL